MVGIVLPRSRRFKGEIAGAPGSRFALACLFRRRYEDAPRVRNAGLRRMAAAALCHYAAAVLAVSAVAFALRTLLQPVVPRVLATWRQALPRLANSE
jgi:hypothetical protein